MLIKYSEIYLGVKYRVADPNHTYHGGSIYYLKHAFNKPFISTIAALLLCIYGVEIYQFKVVTDSISQLIFPNFFENHLIIVIGFLILVLYSSFGGVSRVANICTWLMPIFIIIYVVACFIVLMLNINLLPSILLTVVKSAFIGHAPVGGFIGSTMLLAAQQGIARAVYSGDIGIGYDSIIQSETKAIHPEMQARLGIFASVTDTVVCSMSILVVMITGLWKDTPLDEASNAVANALSIYFPYMNIFMIILIFLAGYTIIAYLVVGAKCAKFLNPRFGYQLYFFYAMVSFIFFSYFDQDKLLMLMQLAGGALVFINVMGILKLRNQIKFL
jgi:AGCS family alanine or glycine:cation symporter